MDQKPTIIFTSHKILQDQIMNEPYVFKSQFIFMGRFYVKRLFFSFLSKKRYAENQSKQIRLDCRPQYDRLKLKVNKHQQQNLCKIRQKENSISYVCDVPEISDNSKAFISTIASKFPALQMAHNFGNGYPYQGIL
jgi:hypothetical protein